MRHIWSKVRIAFTVVSVALAAVIAVKQLPAAFTRPPTVKHIEIDGVDFGRFDAVSGLEQFGPDGDPLISTQAFATIQLRREFVTSPSLYLWAKNQRSKMNELHDIHLIEKSADGSVTRRYILKYCQPLSWAVEAVNPALGGFNESIDLAVQGFYSEE